MKTFFIAAGTLLLLLSAALYTLLFTTPGNTLVAPLLESKIKEKTQLPLTLERFELTMSRFAITLQLSQNNRLEAAGNYSLFTQELDAAYRLRLSALEELQPLTQQRLYGKLKADGNITGSAAKLLIKGSSDLAQSQSTYEIELLELAPAKVIATIKQLQLGTLLKMGGQAAYATGVLDADIQLDDLDPQHLKGYADIAMKNGIVNTAAMQKDFNVTLPKTTFDMKGHAKLAAKEIDYTLGFHSNLAAISSKGRVSPETLASDLVYDLAIKELALFKPLTKAPLRGPLKLSGSLKGDRSAMTLKGNSDIARSKTALRLELAALQPRALKLESKGLELASLLYMLELPHYADGRLDITADLSDMRADALKGTIKSSIAKGRADAKVLAENFELKNVPSITFEGRGDTVLKGSQINSQLRLESSLATLLLKDLKIDLQKERTTASYRADIPDLDRLYFLSERHMKGALSLEGEITKDAQLLASAHSKLLGGTLDAQLKDNALHADFASIQTRDALKMLLYPDIFASSLDGTLDYRLDTKKGKLDAQLHQGRFTKNAMIDLVKQYGNYNLYNETFESTLTSRIDAEKTDSDLDMKAGNATIKGKNIALDTKSRRIDAKLDIVANRNPLKVRLRGDVNAPQVDVDATKLLEKEAGKILEKEVGKFLKGLF